jgi:hypothetical protein
MDWKPLGRLLSMTVFTLIILGSGQVKLVSTFLMMLLTGGIVLHHGIGRPGWNAVCHRHRGVAERAHQPG